MTFVKGYKLNGNERKKSLITFIAATVAAAALVTAFFIIPAQGSGLYAPCPWYAMTGTYCPGCGTLRGLEQTVHGNIFGLVEYNIMAAVAAPFILYAYAGLTLGTLGGFRLPSLRLSRYEIYILLAVIMIYWVVRNFIPLLSP